MENITTLTLEPVTGAQPQTIEGVGNQTKKVNISDYAYKQAGLHLGDANSLTTYLGWIKEGHIIDEGFSEQENLLTKKKVVSAIQEKECEKAKLDSEKVTITDVKIPAAKNEVNETKGEIDQVKLDIEDGRIKSDYQPIRFVTYSALTILLGIYLIFFYASAIHSAFFRNAQSLIANAGDDILLYLDSIFDAKAIFIWDTSLVFTYFGAFLFFAIGLLPIAMVNEEKKNSKLYAGLLIAGAFIADAAIAYKIDKGMHDLKILSGIPDIGWRFYTSENFYLVLLFGFCAYLVWGQMYELLIKEKSKKNTDKKAAIIINTLKEKLKEQKDAQMLLEVKVKELEAAIAGILLQMEKLKKDLETARVNPDELARSLQSFYIGWRRFLMGSSEFEPQRIDCETAYKGYINSLFITAPQSLN